MFTGDVLRQGKVKIEKRDRNVCFITVDVVE